MRTVKEGSFRLFFTSSQGMQKKKNSTGIKRVVKNADQKELVTLTKFSTCKKCGND